MKRWLLVTLALSGLASAAAVLWWAPEPVPAAVLVPSPAPVSPPPAVAAAMPVEPVAMAAPSRPPAPPVPPPEPARFSPVEAQVLMQVMAEQGDPRQPARGGLKPRERASAAQLADPAAYSAFEDEQTRSLVQAWARGVEQIPAIREAISQAESSGERSSAELEEARAALGQLESMQGYLERRAPQGAAPAQ